jgi:phenylalanyl-tRNA synthetase beta subunit
VALPEKIRKKTKSAVLEKVSQFLEERGVDDETREAALERIAGSKPRRVPRVMEKVTRSTGVQKRGPGERFDFYVKKNHVEEPKHLYSGKMGFKRDFK